MPRRRHDFNRSRDVSKHCEFAIDDDARLLFIFAVISWRIELPFVADDERAAGEVFGSLFLLVTRLFGAVLQQRQWSTTAVIPEHFDRGPRFVGSKLIFNRRRTGKN